MLPDAEEAAWAAEAQVLSAILKPSAVLVMTFQPLPRLLVAVVGDQMQ